MVGHGQVSPAECKLAAVRAFPQPTTKKLVRQFLGLTGYYRRFIDRYAEHSFHLTEATKKSAPDGVIMSNALCDEYFYLQRALCVVPFLSKVTPLFSRPLPLRLAWARS